MWLKRKIKELRNRYNFFSFLSFLWPIVSSFIIYFFERWAKRKEKKREIVTAVTRTALAFSFYTVHHSQNIIKELGT